jgi:hypothetical protein
MSTLIVSGVIRGSASTMCNFSVSVNGGPFLAPDKLILDQAFFNIPDQNATVTVRATPLDTAKYGVLDGSFNVDAMGNLQPAGAPEEFTLPQTIGLPPLHTILLFVHFTPLINVTERARNSLNPAGAGFPGTPPPGNMTFRGPFFTPMPPATLAPRNADRCDIHRFALYLRIGIESDIADVHGAGFNHDF